MIKPTVGVYGLTSCAGDQLAILNCEDELLDILGAVHIKSFVMAQSRNIEGVVDVALVEGAVAQPEDEKKLKEIRANSSILIAIGSCAVWGGIMASKNDVLRQRMVDTVYGSQNTTIISQPPAPLSDFVAVEYALPGCPIEKHEFIQSLASLLHGDAPVLPTYPICVECKAKENICLLVRQGLFCMGPLTVAGCGARCPSHSRPCAGCRGPVKEANIASEAEILKERGFWAPDIARRLVTFAYPAKPMDLLKTPAWLEAAMV